MLNNGDFSVTKAANTNILIQYLQLFIDISSKAVGSIFTAKNKKAQTFGIKGLRFFVSGS